MKSIVTPIFKSKEEEEKFSKIAQERINPNSKLQSENKSRKKKMKCEVAVIFHSAEEEKMFSEYAKEIMFKRESKH